MRFPISSVASPANSSTWDLMSCAALATMTARSWQLLSFHVMKQLAAAASFVSSWLSDNVSKVLRVLPSNGLMLW